MDTTNSKHKEQLRKLIRESMDQSMDENMHCPSMLAIQDIDFRVVRIEQKLDSIIRFLKRRVKPVLEDMSEETKQ